MDRAIRLAEAIREHYAITGLAADDQMDEIIHGQGLKLWAGPELTGPIRGYRLFEMIVVAKNATPGERAAVKAHEIGHALMHTGNALYLAQPSSKMLASRQEREAQLFAITLLLGPVGEGFDQRLHEAFDRGVPMEFLCAGINALLQERGGHVVPDHRVAAIDRYDIDVDSLVESR